MEPNPHAANVERVAQIGISTAFKKENVYQGRGYKAPMAGSECHHCGSQGKH